MGGTLSQAGRSGGHALAGRARIRHAPEPLHRVGQNWPAASVHGGGDELLEGDALAGRTATLQDTRDAPRQPRKRRLNSTTVSGVHPHRRQAALPLAGGRSERGRARYPRPEPAQRQSSSFASCCAACNTSRGWSSPTSSGVTPRQSVRSCPASSPGKAAVLTTGPRCRTSRRVDESGRCSGSSQTATPPAAFHLLRRRNLCCFRPAVPVHPRPHPQPLPAPPPSPVHPPIPLCPRRRLPHLA